MGLTVNKYRVNGSGKNIKRLVAETVVREIREGCTISVACESNTVIKAEFHCGNIYGMSILR